MIDWDDCTSLTKEEFLEFINLGIPKMEEKHDWDFQINGFSIKDFCFDLFCYSYETNGWPESYKDDYPKVKDLRAIRQIATEYYSWRKENFTYYNDKTRSTKIYELILSKLYAMAEEIF